jgi:hypothetical protein
LSNKSNKTKYASDRLHDQTAYTCGIKTPFNNAVYGVQPKLNAVNSHYEEKRQEAMHLPMAE